MFLPLRKGKYDINKEQTVNFLFTGGNYRDIVS